jgi:hypothetical protein
LYLKNIAKSKQNARVAFKKNTGTNHNHIYDNLGISANFLSNTFELYLITGKLERIVSYMCKVLIGGSDIYFYENIFKYVIHDFLKQICHIQSQNCSCSKAVEIQYYAHMACVATALDIYKPDIIVFDENFEFRATKNQRSMLEDKKNKIIKIGYCQKNMYNKDELFKLFFDHLRTKRAIPS